MYEIKNPAPVKKAGLRKATVAVLLLRVTVSALFPGQNLSENTRKFDVCNPKMLHILTGLAYE